MINTQDDWWKLAEETIPHLETYFNYVGVTISISEFTEAFNERDNDRLHALFELGWTYLPDRKGIHMYPFSNLCDLCSEYWVFQEVPK